MKRRMNGYLLAGLIVTGLMAALILVGLVWTPYDPDALFNHPERSFCTHASARFQVVKSAPSLICAGVHQDNVFGLERIADSSQGILNIILCDLITVRPVTKV